MKKKIIIIILVVLAIALVGIGAFLFLTKEKSDKTVFMDSVSKGVGNVFDGLKTDNGTVDYITKMFEEGKSLRADMNLKATTEGEVVADFVGDMYITQEDIYALIAMDGLDAEVLMKDSKLYYKVKDILPVFYYTELEEEMTSAAADTELSLTDEQNEKLNQYLVDAIEKNVTDEDFTSKKVDVTILGKEYTQIRKITLNLTDKMINEVFNDFLASLKNDKEFSELLNNEELKTALEGLTEAEGTNEVLCSFSLYADGDTYVRYQFAVPVSSEEEKITMNFDIVGEDFGISMDYTTMKLFSLQVKSTSSTKKTISGNILGMGTLNGTYEDDGKEAKLDLTLDLSSADMGVFKLTMNASEVKANEEYALTVDFTSDFVTLDFDVTMYFGVEFPDVDVSGALPDSEMTDDQREAISSLLSMLDMSQVTA